MFVIECLAASCLLPAVRLYPCRLRTRSIFSTALVLIIGVLPWGAFAFGAVYPWAYWPLVAAYWHAGIGCRMLTRFAVG